MHSKGQLISKCLFDVFTFFQKTNENKWTSSKDEFVRSFFGRNVGLKNHFEFVWPLEFIWTERYSGLSSKTGPALANLLILQQVQILGLFLCMVSLIDLLTNPYQKGFQKNSVLNVFIIFEDFHQTQAMLCLF